MKRIHALICATALCAAMPTMAQTQQPLKAPGDVNERRAERPKLSDEAEDAKREARKARREHRRMVNHRQRHRH